MNVYDIFFDGIAKVYAEEPETAREILLSQLSKTPGLILLDVGKATRVGGTAPRSTEGASGSEAP